MSKDSIVNWYGIDPGKMSTVDIVSMCSNLYGEFYGLKEMTDKVKMRDNRVFTSKPRPPRKYLQKDDMTNMVYEYYQNYFTDLANMERKTSTLKTCKEDCLLFAKQFLLKEEKENKVMEEAKKKEVSKRKYIKYEVVGKTGDESVIVEITEQSHRRYEFGFNDGSVTTSNKRVFTASNRLRLESDYWPDVDKIENTVFLRGDLQYDSKLLVMPSKMFKDFEIAVKEYNILGARADESAEVKSALGNLKYNIGNMQAILNKYVCQLTDAKTSNEFVALKFKLLHSLLESYPISPNVCPFCIKNKFPTVGVTAACSSCEYGKKHGICTANGSDYVEIRAAIDRLKGALRTAITRT